MNSLHRSIASTVNLGSRLADKLAQLVRRLFATVADWSLIGGRVKESLECSASNLIVDDVPGIVEFHPNSLVKDTIVALRPLLGKRIRVELDLDENVGLLRAELGQARWLLTQLCIEACDAMPNGGLLLINTKDVVLTAADCEQRSGVQLGRYLSLVVSDTRERDSVQSRIPSLASLRVCHRDVGETNIELATVHDLVERWNGAMSVHHEQSLGRVVTIYLPTANRPSDLLPTVCGDEAREVWLATADAFGQN